MVLETGLRFCLGSLSVLYVHDREAKEEPEEADPEKEGDKDSAEAGEEQERFRGRGRQEGTVRRSRTEKERKLTRSRCRRTVRSSTRTTRTRTKIRRRRRRRRRRRKRNSEGTRSSERTSSETRRGKMKQRNLVPLFCLVALSPLQCWLCKKVTVIHHFSCFIIGIFVRPFLSSCLSRALRWGEAKVPPFLGSPLFHKAPPKTISVSKMQIDALQNTNCRGEISVYFYTKTADWRSPIPFWRVSIYILEGANLHFAGRRCLGGAFFC